MSSALNPGRSVSTKNPRTLLSSFSTLAQTTATSAIDPEVIHIFSPLSTYSFPPLRARVFIPPGFDPTPGGMKTRARKVGNEYVLNGEKMWITSGSIADVAGVWAKVENEDNKVRGFLVEPDRPGFKAADLNGKWCLRASVTSVFSLQDVRIPESNLLPKTDGLKSPLMCLNQARYGIAWGGIGAAMSCYDCALQYSLL